MERSLPSNLYQNATVFAGEKSHILCTEWFCAGRIEDVPKPGDYVVLDVASESVIIVYTKAGDIRAHYNVCRHRGARLCDRDNDARWGLQMSGGVSGNLIRCPYHNWTYSLEGALIATPKIDDVVPMNKTDFGLYPVGVETWGGFLFVNLTPATAPDFMASLDEAPRRLGNYPLADLRIARSISYDVHANWKLILENYNECYHCPGVHPELCDLVPEFRNNGGMHPDWEAGIPHRNGATTYTKSGTSNRQFFPGLTDDEKIRHKGELIYPNLMLSVSSDHAAAFILWPEAVNRTRIDCHFLFHKAEILRSDFDPADAVDFWDMVNRQDWAVCERVQRGLSARVHEYGYYSPMEDGSLDIRRYVTKRMPE